MRGGFLARFLGYMPVAKALIPEPINCTPIQTSKNPINLLITIVPEGPSLRPQKSADRITAQQTILQKMMAKVIIKKVAT